MHLATLYNPIIVNSIVNFSGEQYINRIVPILIYLGLILCAIAFIILLIIGGIQYVTSEGDKPKLEGARSKIVNAITGLIVLLLLWFILQILNLIFGVNIGGFGPPGIRPTSPPVPTVGVPTPTPPGAGTCSCDLGIVITDNCIPPYVAECIGQPGCHCVLPGVPTPTPGGGIGTPCNNGGECASGLCGRDMDGDSFKGLGTGTCMAVGEAVDCNDNNNLVYPGQTQYFETPISGTNFDYDCNGTNDKWPRLDCLAGAPPRPACQLTPLTEAQMRPYTGWQNFVPDCGATLNSPYQSFYSCNASHYNNCTANPEVWDNPGCFADCVTGNQCDWSEDQPCISWRIEGWGPNIYFSGTGITRMSCK